MDLDNYIYIYIYISCNHSIINKNSFVFIFLCFLIDTSKALVPYHTSCSCLWPNIDRLHISSPNRTTFGNLFGNSCIERHKWC